MTQQQPQAETPPRDPFKDVFHNIDVARKRLRETATNLPATDPSKQLYMELTGTVLKLLHDVTAEVRKYSDNGFSYFAGRCDDIEDRCDELDGRINDVEEPSTQFTPEHGELFKFLIQSGKQLAELTLKNPSVDATQREFLQDIISKSDEAIVIIDENTLGDDDEDDAGDGDDEQPE